MKDGSKYSKWCKFFLDPKSPTRGNATKSALRVYGSKNYHTAGAIGHQNYKKLQLTGLAIVEERGFSVRDWYMTLASKAIKGSYEQTVDFMERIGIIEPNGNSKSRKRRYSR